MHGQLHVNQYSTSDSARWRGFYYIWYVWHLARFPESARSQSQASTCTDKKRNMHEYPKQASNPQHVIRHRFLSSSIFKVLRDCRVGCIYGAAQERDNQGRNTRGPAGQLPGKPTYKGSSEVIGIIGNLVPVKPVSTRNRISPKIICNLGTTTQKGLPALPNNSRWSHRRSIFKNLLTAHASVNWRQFREVKLNLYFKFIRYYACLLFCSIYC